jgi:hypothetical protein
MALRAFLCCRVARIAPRGAIGAVAGDQRAPADLELGTFGGEDADR